MRIANFCPICGAPTTMRERFGKVRPVCSQCNHTVFFEPKVAVVVFVTNGEQILLVQRANDPARDTWALPAGFVDPEEDPREAARRETLEETGLAVEITQLIDVLHRPDANGLADIVLAFRAEVIGGQLHAGDDAADAGWFARTALPEIGFKTTEILLSRWSEIDGS